MRKIPGQVHNYQTFQLSLVSVQKPETSKSTQEQLQEYCNWRKEALFRLLINFTMTVWGR